MKEDTDKFIHETATIEAGVSVGEGTKIWHQCHVRESAFIGNNVSLGKDVFIDKEVVISDGCRIQNGVSIYQGVKIDKWVFVGPHVTFTNDRFPRAGIKKWKRSETILNPGCSIGAGSIISCDLTIGSFSLIGAGSIVTENISAFQLAYGVPCKVISKICACGETKVGLDECFSKCIQNCCEENLKEEVLVLAKAEVSREKS